MKPLICIVGPTASGKTEVSNRVARALNAHVFSIDAYQIYKDMDIGTAKASPEERLVPHELIDIAEIGEDYSAAKFQKVARKAIDAQLSLKKWCVLAGGTGLYLDAVIDEMDFAKGKAGDAIREKLEARSSDDLFTELKLRDPKSAQLIDKANKRRLVRALEMLAAKTTYSNENQKLHERTAHYSAKLFSLMWPRDVLYERIYKRTKQMYEEGLIAETKKLKAAGLELSRTARQAIGYAEALAVLEGTINEEEAIVRTAKRTRHYAKRQLSWLKRDGRAQMIDMKKKTSQDAADFILNSISELSE